MFGVTPEQAFRITLDQVFGVTSEQVFVVTPEHVFGVTSSKCLESLRSWIRGF